ncbi:MAG TPA: Rieske 2Fe-2S domain-containing protein [Ilumatobacteraceae bacterium]|nr:Rieske 2Fe-2S domain-containing protein [Ilumatobacteraceae bacterium]HRB03175.1 Rieske 2Fe-2S domain-containing protein [Ilumatobacteraceae bacterium]
MSPAVIIALAVGVIVVLFAVVLLVTARKADVRGAGALSRETRRRDRDADIDLPVAPTGRSVERAAVEDRAQALVPAAAAPPSIWIPPDREEIGFNRRQFLNRSTVVLMSTGLLTFAAASFVAFLWPTAAPVFGGKVNVGKLNDILASIRSNGGFFYASNARSWVTVYPSEAIPKARGVKEYQPLLSGMEQGIIVMYQKCPHLGCRVPECKSSQWFECPCHGSQYNRSGEKKGGPAPRGMDHFAVAVGGSGDVIIDTSTVFTGAPIGTNTTGQEAEGPHCITGGGGHG